MVTHIHLEFPEWYTVDENRLYTLQRDGDPAAPLVALGSELAAGVAMAPGLWWVKPAGAPPYGIHARPVTP